MDRVARVLVGCELSGVVRRAFTRAGCEAWSNDLEPCEDNDPRHLQMDVKQAVLEHGPWDLMVCHPPCTRLAISGRRWFKGREAEQEAALDLVRWLMVYQRVIPRVCLENPISVISTKVRQPDQIIQPWQFGHGETKATCLWLRNLPLLKYTRITGGRDPNVHYMPPGPDQSRLRSRTYVGIAKAMAEQWGPLILEK